MVLAAYINANAGCFDYGIFDLHTAIRAAVADVYMYVL